MRIPSVSQARSALLAVICVTAAGTAAAAQVAATAYPQRPVRMLVPYPPGGGLDPVGRSVSQKFLETTGTTMVMDNRGGAGGLIATELVAKAAPDGYTLLLASNGQISIAPWLYPRLPFDAMNDFAPVMHFVDTPMVMFAAASFAPQTLKDLVAEAKAKPGTISVALSGLGGVSHLTYELFRQKTGLNLVGVPYKGAGSALGDVASGSVPVIISTLAAAKGLLDTGRVRALAVSLKKRSSALPNVPSFAELGFAEVQSSLWIGMLAPRGTPQAVIDRLSAEFTKAMAAPDTRERMAAQSAEIVAGGPREFRRMIQEDADRWRAVIKQGNIKIE